MSIFALINRHLNYFGFKNKSGRILFIGLDNSGKTSLLNLLKNKNQSGYALPTQHPTSQELIIGNILFTKFTKSG